MKLLSISLILLIPFLGTEKTDYVSCIPEACKLIISEEHPDILLTFEVDEGYHIQAGKSQITDEFLIPTQLVVEPVEGLKICEISYPEISGFRQYGSTANLIFREKFSVKIHTQLEGSLKPGVRILKGVLHYQACDDRKCYFPQTLAFETAITIQ